MKGLHLKLKWYFANFPVGCLLLLIILSMSFYVMNAKQILDDAICLHPDRVLSGEVSRLITYAFFHKNFETLSLSLVMICIFGTIVERQMGTVRFIYFVVLFTMLTPLLALTLSTLLTFSGHIPSMMQSCIGLGMTPSLFGILIVLFQNFPLKRTILLFFTLPTIAIPWCLLVIAKLIVPDTTFLSNMSGCIIGTIYGVWLSSCLTLLPVGWIREADRVFMGLFEWIPFLNYVQQVSLGHPMSGGAFARSSRLHNPPGLYPQQSLALPDDHPVTVPETSVSQYKLKKLEEMGFTKEQSVIALAAASDRVEQAANLISDGKVGDKATAVLIDDT